MTPRGTETAASASPISHRSQTSRTASEDKASTYLVTVGLRDEF
jgi:hypothetical protein